LEKIEKNKVTPLVAAPGDTNPSDATDLQQFRSPVRIQVYHCGVFCDSVSVYICCNILTQHTWTRG